MNAFDHRIGLEQHVFRRTEVEHGAVISRRDNDRIVARQRRQKARDEFALRSWLEEFLGPFRLRTR